jgi:hypothetical protein
MYGMHRPDGTPVTASEIANPSAEELARVRHDAARLTVYEPLRVATGPTLPDSVRRFFGLDTQDLRAPAAPIVLPPKQ